ncbi:MAG: Flp family type IVb pilin [Chloroflexi bacterium]|nr:Flp family type IVb pilin [Chloroflexota bacterium]
MKRTNNHTTGQGLVEYALLIFLMSVLLAAALVLLHDQISGFFSNLGEMI